MNILFKKGKYKFVKYIERKYYMSVTNREYKKMTEIKSPNSPIVKNLFWAFLVGGAICTIGQVIYNVYEYYGLNQLDSSTATSITLIFLSALLTGLKIYDNLAKRSGAGTLVPITGFANAIVAPALEFKSEGYMLGMSAKMFTIAGPVLVFGIASSILYGLVIWIFRLF
jgi:stage V sporulation protein AC